MAKRVVGGLLGILVLLPKVAVSTLYPDNMAVKSTPIGNAAWLYPENQQQIEDWKAQLTKYNLAAGAERAIRVLYVYSTDLEITYTKPVMGSLTETAAAAFRTIPNVTHVAAIIDSWLGASYANMNTLSIAKLQALADAHAQLYCASTLLSGVQLDLEPYSTTYKTSVLTFVKRLAQNFRDSAVCSRGPKFLSFFVGPRQADAALFNALGPNGFAVVSGYDLDSPGPGLPETPQQYKTNLKSNIQFVMSTAATSTYGKFAIGLPFSASVCEFETAISITDPSKVIAGYPMYNTSQPGYIPAAFEVLNQTLGVNATRLDSRYLGVSVWGFLSRDVVVSGYRHLPKNAFDTPGLMTYLLSNMPKKAAMTP